MQQVADWPEKIGVSEYAERFTRELTKKCPAIEGFACLSSDGVDLVLVTPAPTFQSTSVQLIFGRVRIRSFSV